MPVKINMYDVVCNRNKKYKILNYFVSIVPSDKFQSR